MPEFPKAYHIVRKAALRLALTRALVKAAQMIKRLEASNRRGAGPSTAGASITAIFDMALEQAAEARQQEAAEEDGKKEPIPLSLKSFDDVGRTATIKHGKPASPLSGIHPAKLGRWGKLQRSVAGGGANGGPDSPPRSFRADAPASRRSLSASLSASRVSPSVFGPRRAAMEHGAGGAEATTGAIAQVNDRLGRLEASMAACLRELQSLRRQPTPPRDTPAVDARALGGCGEALPAADDCEPTSPEALREQRRRRPRRNSTGQLARRSKLAGGGAKAGARAGPSMDRSESSERRELREENAREYSHSRTSPFISAGFLELDLYAA